MAHDLVEQLDANVGYGAIAYPLHKVGIAVRAKTAHAHHQGNEEARQQDRIYFRTGIQKRRVFRELLGARGTAALENDGGHFGKDPRYEPVKEAESETEGEAEDEAPLVGLYVAIEPLVRTPTR